MSKEGEFENAEVQAMKTKHNQSEENKKIQNEDAFYKYTAYAGSIEKKRRENLADTQTNQDIGLGVHRFEPYYQKILHRDIKLPPRPINPDDYTQSKRVDPYDKGFRTTREREADYFNEFPKFKENKSKIPPLSDDFVYRGANREKSVVLRFGAVLC